MQQQIVFSSDLPKIPFLKTKNSSEPSIIVLPRKGLRAPKYGSSDTRKIRILSYLYSYSEGANQNTIQGLPGLNAQRWDLVKKSLTVLIESGSIIAEEHDEVRKGAIIYKITDRGINTIETLKEMQNKGLGKGFEIFKGLEFD